MQVLNKGYIIKAVHSTCRTIGVLGRGMDYSYNKRNRGVVASCGGRTEAIFLHCCQNDEREDTGSSQLIISTHCLNFTGRNWDFFLKSSFLSPTAQSYIYLKTSAPHLKALLCSRIEKTSHRYTGRLGHKSVKRHQLPSHDMRAG